jgi:monothiol glutaredoxin
MTLMDLSPTTREKIENYLDQDRVVLFMKGTPGQPMCGFSAKTAGILDGLLETYTSVDVLMDQDIREGIKTYGQWPTIPQLYIDQELVGGCDIISAMYNNGELHEMLGMEKPDRTSPEVTISDRAVEKIREALAGHEGVGLHLQVEPDFQARFSLAPVAGNEIVSEANGITLLFDLASAQRARGASIDWVESMQGEGLSIDLPEAPAPAPQMSVQELKSRLDNDSITLVDVRPADEREKAAIEGAQPMDAALMDRLEALPTDTAIAFICHTGKRSLVAAEHFRRQGFTDVSNVEGGIHAWSLEIDPDVPVY